MEETRFARLITMKVKKGKGRKFVETFESQVASSAVRIKGLRRLYLLRPTDKKNEFVALSLWDDEASAKAYVKSGRNDAYNAKLANLLKKDEKVRAFGVETHVVGVGTKGPG